MKTNATDWKLGISTCGSVPTEDAYWEDFAAHGVGMAELSPAHDGYASLDFDAVSRSARRAGVTLWSFHLPFSPFEAYDISASDKARRTAALKAQCELASRAAACGIGVIVIHPSGEPNAESRREEGLKYSAESLAVLAEKLSSEGAVVAVEDLPRTCLGNCSGDIRRLVADHEKLRVCFDTNHLLIEKNADFIRAIGEKIITLHVSDYDFRNERHWLPYEGKVDWVELVSLLEEKGYKGPFMYEVAFRTPTSISRRDLVLDDFVENYKACIGKTPYRPFGVPNEKACRENAYFEKPVI